MADEERQDYIRYTGNQIANTDYHDGRLRPAVGVHHIQVLRANRKVPEEADGYGWTYNHAPMLAYWRGTFYLEYISDEVSEHVPPCQTLLMTSKDGMHWSKPRVIFPEYVIPDGIYRNPSPHELPKGSLAVMHQRMGFYESPEGKLLVVGFYGICPHYRVFPNNGLGIGRVVREIHEDGEAGPIYFIRYNRHAGWNETNTHYPPYNESGDAAFNRACESLLANRLATMQWWEEDRSEDGFYSVAGERAPSTYTLPDGRVMAVFKSGRAAVSEDGGNTWSEVRDVPTLITAGGKVWGQRTSDGRYALVHNPTPADLHRWPLAIATGKDGVEFDRLLLLGGDVSPRRYDGLLKGYGPQYVRGLETIQQTAAGGTDMWLTYSMNKEDIWVSRVPVPIADRVAVHVDDEFDKVEAGTWIPNWNVYSPVWAPVSVVDTEDGRCLQLMDRDSYDYAKAVRVFPENSTIAIRAKVRAEQNDHGRLFIEVCSGNGTFPLRLLFDSDGRIKVLKNGQYATVQHYAAGQWYEFQLAIDTVRQTWSLEMDGQKTAYRFIAPVTSVERIEFRTGEARKHPTLETPVDTSDLPDADYPVPPATYRLQYLKTAGE